MSLYYLLLFLHKLLYLYYILCSTQTSVMKMYKNFGVCKKYKSKKIYFSNEDDVIVFLDKKDELSVGEVLN